MQSLYINCVRVNLCLGEFIGKYKVPKNQNGEVFKAYKKLFLFLFVFSKEKAIDILIIFKSINYK